MTSRTETAANKAFEDETAKVAALAKISKSIATKAAQDFENAIKELGIDYCDFHNKSAANRNHSPMQELLSDIRVQLIEAIEFPNPDQAAQSASDAAYFAVAAE